MTNFRPEVGAHSVLCSRRRLNTADSTESDPGPRLLTSSSSDGGRPSGPLSSGADLPAARASGSSPPKGQKLEPRFLVVAGVKLGHVGCPNGRSRNSECSAGGVYGAAQAVAHPARLNLGGRGGESVPSPVMRRYGSSGSLFTMQDGHAMLTPADHGGNMGASSRSLSHAGTSLGLRLNSDPLPDSVPEHTEALMQDCVHATSLSSIQVWLQSKEMVAPVHVVRSAGLCLIHGRSPCLCMAFSIGCCPSSPIHQL